MVGWWDGRRGSGGTNVQARRRQVDGRQVKTRKRQDKDEQGKGRVKSSQVINAADSRWVIGNSSGVVGEGERRKHEHTREEAQYLQHHQSSVVYLKQECWLEPRNCSSTQSCIK